jgi:hypothetical protein
MAEGRKSFQKVVKGLAAADVERRDLHESVERCRQTADLSSGPAASPACSRSIRWRPAGAAAVMAELGDS